MTIRDFSMALLGKIYSHVMMCNLSILSHLLPLPFSSLLPFSPTPSPSSSSLLSSSSLSSSFFVVEDTVLHTTQSLTKTGSRDGDEGLITQKIVHEFWSMAQDEALAVLRNNCVRN